MDIPHMLESASNIGFREKLLHPLLMRSSINYKGEPISERGIRKLVVKYRKDAGITKRASCHTLRHTFATYKAEKGVSPFQLQQWLGHANLNTTQIYVHLGKQNAKKIMEQTSLA